MSDEADCAALLDACTDRFGGCDILLNNAGIIVAGSILDATIEDFDRVMAVNLRGTFLLGRLVARHMVESGTRGTIINMSSTNAVVTIPDQLPYAASKGGVAQMTKAMAMALAPHDIRVNAIGPGTILTDMLKVVIANDRSPAHDPVAHADGPDRRPGRGCERRRVPRVRLCFVPYRRDHLPGWGAVVAQLHRAVARGRIERPGGRLT